ncbi:hypothetical protein [Pseudodesulfovibrio sp. zrk46]|uniref:hypothetical protein n=1 Tax=Pseudodesulfovibrio sp. zrk46 TaxID=2725288 RepID=UPI00144A05CB|nr:hypothetical protein [Pseudodesulfovibrio sp. zrk46]QJB56814.1 hypothetical protein HFN16_10530 [Pseudodesulfovibrio sp. zrk46]
MRKFLFFICMTLVMPVCAQAGSDIIATYKYSDGNMMTLCTRDSNHVRMDTSPTSYMLLKDDKVYSVNRDDEGKWHVMDMAQMNSMGGGFTSMFGGGDSAPEYDVRYEKTGKTEKVAGYSGSVYKAVVFEDGKVVSRDEIVLCSHSNLKKLTNGWIAVATRMNNNQSKAFDDSLEEAQKMGYGGVLRYGDSMRLSSLKVKNLKSSYYELPSGAQQVTMQQPPQQAEGSDMGLDDDAAEIGQDAKQATKDELKDAIRGTISDLFN